MKRVHEQSILGVFFSYGVGVSTWERQGMLSREISLYQALLQDTFEKVYFFTYTKENPELVKKFAQQGIEIKEKKNYLPNFLYSFLMPFFYSQEMKECVVYKTTQVFGSWTAVIAKFFYHKPVVVRAGFALSTNLRSQSMVSRSLAKFVEYVGLKFANRVIVTTSAIRDLYQKYTDKIVVIPNFVDTKVFSPVEKKDVGQKIILFVGRLSAEKNIKNLILAVREKEDITLHIIGEGEERENLKHLTLGSKANIQFLGSISHEQLPKYFAEADIFVLPSLFEGHPKVLVEAMAAGLAIVGTDVRGIQNLIQHNKTGILTGTEALDIAQGIQKFVDDPSLRLQLGKNARAQAEKELSFEQIVLQEKDIYAELKSK